MSWVNSVLRQFLPNGPKGRTVGRKVPATHHSRPEGSGRQAVSVSWGGYLPGETTVTAETNARRYESTDSSLLTPGLDYTRLFISLTAAAGTICMSLLPSSPSLLVGLVSDEERKGDNRRHLAEDQCLAF